MVSGTIHQILQYKNIQLPDFTNYVYENKSLGTSSGLSCFQKTGFLKKIFSKTKQITVQYDSQNLIGEHIYTVISMLKDNGFKNIKSTPVKDIGRNSDNYIFEVNQVVIYGMSFFKYGDNFLENAEVNITYHIKETIAIPYTLNYFRKKNYLIVCEQLQNMGFSNISMRRISDLVTGWIKKEGSVEQVLVKLNGKETPISKNTPYVFDTEIVITHHTFK